MFLVLTYLALSLAGATRAQAAPLEADAVGPSAECVHGNLLASARRSAAGVPESRLSLLTDGVLAREGSPWPSEQVIVVVREQVSFDLGTVVALEQLYVQIDADQAFSIELSGDGSEWTRQPVSPSATATGLVFRMFNLNHAQARFVRLRATSEPRTLTLAEVGASCHREAKLRHRLAVAGPAREAWEASWSARITRALTGAPAISPHATNVVKWLLAILATLLACFELRRRRHLPVAVWVLLALAAVTAYFNFGAYRYPDFVHDHDVFHYFVGAKYFPELGYRGIYDCAAVAEAEAGFPQRVQLRAQRNLVTNQIEPGQNALARGADCPKRFGPSRWDAFRRDVAYFADGRALLDWHRVLRDHGFNATPTWIALARSICARLAATEQTIGHRNAAFGGIVGALDPLILLATAVALVWAFGLRTAALVAIVFACNPFSEFAWVGGAFLRQAWLSALIIGLCLLKREHFVLGGCSLGFSVLLQLLPLPTLALPLLAGILCAFAASPSVKRWRLQLTEQRALWKMLGGAALALLLLVPASPWLSGGGSVAGVWSAFVSNTEKHEATPAGNLLGLSTLLSFRPSTTVDVLVDTSASDPFARTRAAQSATRRRMRPIQLVIVALALAAMAYVLRRPRPLWWISTLGLALVPLGVDASCYYSAWLCAFALIGHSNERWLVPVLVALDALLAITLGLTQAGIQTAMASGVIVLSVFAVLWLVARDDRRATTYIAATHDG